MSDNDLLSLVYLHSSWFTQNELKKIFLWTSTFDSTSIWKELTKWIIRGEISEERKKKIIQKSQAVDCKKIETYLEIKNINIIHWFHPQYPEKLKTIGHAPFFLYVRWELRGGMPLIWVVWSRKNTTYAKRVLDKILPDMIHVGVWIISWWANWVDSISHELTIKNNWYTIVVFWTGIDRCYPASNKTLFEEILSSNGALVSHFPLWTWPELYNFPIRNEIVAALSDGILIPEAALSSGTLITAQLALEHGRDVFAIPGDIDRATSEGTNMLLATWQAKCVRCSEDILEEYFDISGIRSGMTPIIKIPPQFSDENEKSIYESIENWLQTVDEIVKQTGMDMSDILIGLAMLEINGYIKLSEMWRYTIL